MTVFVALSWMSTPVSAEVKNLKKNTEVELQQKIDELKNVEEKIDNLLLVDNMKRKKRIRHVNGIPLMQKSCHIDFLALSID
ncbi:MAG: hypothetical protein WCH12_05185 [Candidatus Nitrotoga sp.]